MASRPRYPLASQLILPDGQRVSPQATGLLLLLALTYGAQFGEAATRQMLASWGMTYAVTMGIIEPIQVSCSIAPLPT